MLYNDLVKNSMTIRKAKTLLENASNKVKMEKYNSRSFHIQNECYKELIIKLGVNPNKIQ